jgi:hypothetical protein
MTDEVEDGIPDFISQPDYFFTGLSNDDLSEVVLSTVSSIKPVFTGSLDHRVN